MKLRLLWRTMAVAAGGCLDFEAAYADCYAAGDCREPAGPALVSSVPAAGTNVAGVHDQLTLTFDSEVNPSGFAVVLLPRYCQDHAFNLEILAYSRGRRSCADSRVRCDRP